MIRVILTGRNELTARTTARQNAQDQGLPPLEVVAGADQARDEGTGSTKAITQGLSQKDLPVLGRKGQGDESSNRKQEGRDQDRADSKHVDAHAQRLGQEQHHEELAGENPRYVRRGLVGQDLLLVDILERAKPACKWSIESQCMTAASDMGPNPYALMKPKEQNWQSQPPTTASQARAPPSGGTNGSGRGGAAA